MRLLLFIGVGGFLGSTSRYLVYQLFLKLIPGMYPTGTLVVNVIGSLLLGLLVFASAKFDRDFYMLLTTGFCGGFTTFSTFSVENIRMITSGNYSIALLYIGLSLALGFGAALLGWYIGKTFISI